MGHRAQLSDAGVRHQGGLDLQPFEVLHFEHRGHALIRDDAMPERQFPQPGDFGDGFQPRVLDARPVQAQIVQAVQFRQRLEAGVGDAGAGEGQAGERGQPRQVLQALVRDERVVQGEPLELVGVFQARQPLRR